MLGLALRLGGQALSHPTLRTGMSVCFSSSAAASAALGAAARKGLAFNLLRARDASDAEQVGTQRPLCRGVSATAV